MDSEVNFNTKRFAQMSNRQNKSILGDEGNSDLFASQANRGSAYTDGYSKIQMEFIIDEKSPG